MTKGIFRRLLALPVLTVLLLSACAPAEGPGAGGSGALTWGTWGSYSRHKAFLDLLAETYPEISLEFISYTGINATGYSWAQMRADDIADIFITSRILDENLAKERLIDLSGYDFINQFSTAILDQVSIDGGVYLLPANNTMYGIYYNKSLMEEHGWEVPGNVDELEILCGEIKKEGLIPGVVGTMLTGVPFSSIFNLAKTGWFTTPDGVVWERDFLAGEATAEGRWEETMALAQRYIDMGMFTVDPEDRIDINLIQDYLGNRKAVFCTVIQPVGFTEFPDTGDELGMMPYIGEETGKNIYAYSPSYYFGLSRRLLEPGNEEKLEQAIRLMSLIYSPEGQAALINESTPCVMSALSGAAVEEGSLIYDAQQALWEGRAFPLTYANWDGVLADMGQVYKEWFRGEGGMDGPGCIARMDELQRNYLEHSAELYFCRNTADFTLEETAELLGKALGSRAGVDAVMVPIGEFHDGTELPAGATGKLYEGKINTDIAASICPGYDGEYAVLTMTGAQAKELAQAGLEVEGGGAPFPYLLVTRGGGELEDSTAYQVAFFRGGYTGEVGQAYSAQVYKGSLRELLRDYLEEQGTVSPHGNPWE